MVEQRYYFPDQHLRQPQVLSAETQYFNDLSRIPRLSGEETIGLSRHMRSVQQEITASAPEEQPQLQDQLRGLKNRIIEGNLRLGLTFARRYAERARESGLELGDLISAATIGLTDAVVHFNPELGNRFSTYAAYWIRREILDTIHAQQPFSGVNQYVRAAIIAYRHAEHAILLRGKIPTVASTVEEINKEDPKKNLVLSYEKARQISDFLRRTVDSLDQPIKGDPNLTLRDTISNDPTELTVEEEALENLHKKEAAQGVRSRIKALTPKAQAIITLRYLTPGKQLTLSEIASVLAETEGRAQPSTFQNISEIEKRAFAVLREDPKLQELVF